MILHSTLINSDTMPCTGLQKYVSRSSNPLFPHAMPVSKDHYYRLASNLPQERIQAATALIGELQASNTEQDYKYALNRLISGLASSHDSARLGYSMSLAELLSLLSNNDVFPYTATLFLKDLSSTLDKNVTAKHKGKNLRAYLFAKIFAIQSLTNSSLLNPDTDDDFDTIIKSIIDDLFVIALSKSWIRETAIVTIIKLIQKFNLSTSEIFIPYILSKLASNSLLLSMDGLLVYLNIPVQYRHKLTNLANIDPSIQRWKNDDPITKGNLPFLKDALQDRIIFNPEDEDTDETVVVKGKGKNKGKPNDKDKEKDKIQKGSWTAQLHCVWAPLMNELLQNETIDTSQQSSKSKKRKTNKKTAATATANDTVPTNLLSLSSFWPTFDTTFFANNASPERKHTGLQVLQLVTSLPSFQSSFFSIVLASNITRVLINHLSKKDRVLHSLSLQIMTDLASAAKKMSQHEDSIAVLNLLVALEKQCVLFDRISKTKTIRDLISNIQHDETSRSVEEFETLSQWANESSSSIDLKDDDINDVYSFLLDFSLNLIRGNKSLFRTVFSNEDNEETINLTLSLITSVKKILQFVSSLVYTNEFPKSIENTNKLAKDRLESILADLIEVSKGKVDWTGMVVEFLIQSEKKNALKISVGEEGEIQEIKEKSIHIWSNLYKDIKNAKENDKVDTDTNSVRLNNCLVILFSTGLMELYGGDSESFGILSDLISVYDEMKNVNLQENDVNQQEDLLNTLVDLMLSYLTQKSGLKKKVGSGIWDSVVHSVDEVQLERLFEVLLTRENKMGMEKLFNQEVDGFEGSDEENEDGDDSEDDEEDEGDDNENSDSDSDSDDDDDEGEDEQKSKIDEVEKSTTSALAKALQISDSDDGKSDADDDEDDDDEDMDSDASDESMSDEQMMAIDSQLSAIFQQRQNSLNELKKSSKNGNERKLEAKDARELMALCKLRVLDLLETFSTTYPEKRENMFVVVTLLRTMKLTVNVNVGEKAHKLIKKITKHPFNASGDWAQGKDYMSEQYASVFEISRSSKFNALSQACSQVLLYFTRSLYALTKQEEGPSLESVLDYILKFYKSQLLDWTLVKEDKTNSSVFVDLINWLGSIKNKEKDN